MDIVPVAPAVKDRQEDQQECQRRAHAQQSLAVWHFLRSLNTPVRHFNTFVNLLGGLLSIGKPHALQLTSNEAASDERREGVHSQASIGRPPPVPRVKPCVSRKGVQHSQNHGPLLLLPGPEALNEQEQTPYHRSSAPNFPSPVVGPWEEPETDKQQDKHGPPQHSKQGPGRLISSVSMPDVAHDDELDAGDAVSANNLPTARGQLQQFALCWFDHNHAEDFESAQRSHALSNAASLPGPANLATPDALGTTTTPPSHDDQPPAPPLHFVPQRMTMGVATDKGPRNSMEDFAFAVPLHAHGSVGPMHRGEHHHRPHNQQQGSRFTHAVCFGVFDGHGGAEVAASLAEAVPTGLQNRADRIAEHGPQHVGAILAEQERRLRNRLHRQPHHVHRHHHHSHHRHHHHASPSPSHSRSPARKREHAHGITSPQAAVAMAAAAAAHIRAQEASRSPPLATSPLSSCPSTSPRDLSSPPNSLPGAESGRCKPVEVFSPRISPKTGSPVVTQPPESSPLRMGATQDARGARCGLEDVNGTSQRPQPHPAPVELGPDAGPASSAIPTVTPPMCVPSPSSMSDMAGFMSDGGASTVDGSLVSQLDGRDPGSTALVAAIIDGAMHVANVGDCRLILAEVGADGKVCARRITVDHSPMMHPGEAERLKNLGVPVSADGYVGDFGEGGFLQVSRSIGDFMSKKQLSNQVAGEEVILSEPELHTVTLGPHSLFAVAVSDGVTCALNDDTIVSELCRYLNESVAPKGAPPNTPRVKNNPKHAAEQLVKYVVEVKQTPDNASAVVVSFTSDPPPEPERPRRLFTPRSTTTSFASMTSMSSACPSATSSTAAMTALASVGETVAAASVPA